MNAGYMTDPVIFLIDTLASLYILALLLRFLLQWINAEFYNPIVQFLIKITHPLLRVLRRYIPPIGRIDTSSLLAMLALQMLADYSILLLRDLSTSFAALAVIGVTQLLSMTLNVYIFSIFARAVLSWFSPGHYTAATSLLYGLTEPLLRLCRQWLPAMAGFDLSPLVALIALQIAKMLALPPLQQLAGMLGG